MQHRWGHWRVGTVVDVPDHVGAALCDSDGPFGEPVARRVEPAEPPAPVDYSELTVPEIKARLRDAGLSTSGNKLALLARLEAG